MFMKIKPMKVTKEKIIALKRARAKRPEVVLDKTEMSRRSQALTKPSVTTPPLRSVLGGRGGRTLSKRLTGKRQSTNIVDRRVK